MTIVPIVAIEIPAQVAPDLATEALRSCNLVLGSGNCTLMAATDVQPKVNWHAYVGLDAAQPQSMRIELRDAAMRDTSATRTRWLTFEQDDASTHRWSTAGVVVAALVISAESGRDSGVVPPKPVKYPSPKPQNSPPAQASERTLRFDLGAEMGPGVPGHGVRYGMVLRPSIALTPNLMLWAGLGASHAADPIAVDWWSGSMGLGFVTVVVPHWVSVEARIAPAVNRLSFKVTDAAGARDSASRWRYGVGAGLDAVLDVGKSLGVFVGVEGALQLPLVKIQSAGNEVGQVPTTEVLVTAGLRWRAWRFSQ